MSRVCHGNWPRDFIFVNDTLALVACERSGEVLAMRYDTSTGEFAKISVLQSLCRPVAITLEDIREYARHAVADVLEVERQDKSVVH